MLVEVLVELPVFFSDTDETVFFSWLKRIEAVRETLGQGRSLAIAVSLDQLGEVSLRELIALFKRYGLAMAELAKLDDPRFSDWFRDPRAYWHDSIFRRG